MVTEACSMHLLKSLISMPSFLLFFQLKAQLAPGIKGAPQIRHIAQQQLLLQQRKLPPGQKVTQLTPVKGGVPTQLLVQSPKTMSTMSTMTVQQIQQVCGFRNS